MIKKPLIGILVIISIVWISCIIMAAELTTDNKVNYVEQEIVFDPLVEGKSYFWSVKPEGDIWDDDSTGINYTKDGLEFKWEKGATNTRKAVWSITRGFDWSGVSDVIIDAFNPTDEPLKFTLFLHTGPDWKSETASTAVLNPGKNKDITFETSGVTDIDDIKQVNLQIEGYATSSYIMVNNMRLFKRVVEQENVYESNQFDSMTDNQMGWSFKPEDDQWNDDSVEINEFENGQGLEFVFNPDNSELNKAVFSLQQRVDWSGIEKVFIKVKNTNNYAVRLHLGLHQGTEWRLTETTSTLIEAGVEQIVSFNISNLEKFDQLNQIMQINWIITSYKNAGSLYLSDMNLVKAVEKTEVKYETGHGFIRRSKKDPQRLVFEDGTPFYPIGLNRWAIYVDNNNPGKQDMETYLRNIKAAGINTLRVFLVENNSHVPMSIEPRLGEYSEQYLIKIDRLFELANEYNIYIILAMFDHYDLRHSWTSSVYSARSNGPAENQINFFTNPKAIEYQKKRIKMLVERYTKWPNLLAWEPINETNGVVVDPPANIRDINANWIDQISKYIKSIDPNNHLITASLTGDKYWPELFKPEVVDIIQVHIYADTTNPESIVNLIDMYYAEAEELKKPIIIGEFASQKDNPQRIKYIHDALWTTMLNGGTALLWTHKNDPYGDINEDILDVYAGLSKVAEQLNWTPSQENGVITDKITVDSYFINFRGLKLNNQKLIWLQADGEEEYSTILTIRECYPGLHLISFLDTDTGEVLSVTQKMIDQPGKLELEVPPFTEQIAIIVNVF